MKESITQAAADAATPSQFLSRLVGIMAAHGEDADRLLELAAKAACAEQDARTLERLWQGKIAMLRNVEPGDANEETMEHHPGKYWDAERRADELYFGEGHEQEDEDDEKD